MMQIVILMRNFKVPIHRKFYKSGPLMDLQVVRVKNDIDQITGDFRFEHGSNHQVISDQLTAGSSSPWYTIHRSVFVMSFEEMENEHSYPSNYQ